MNTYDIGDRVNCPASFAVSGVATNPTVTTFSYRKPNGTVTTLTYGTDGALVRDSTGEFHVNLDPDLPGRWDYRWQGTGTVVSAEEGSFSVRARQVLSA